MRIEICGDLHIHLHDSGNEVTPWAEVLHKLDLILNTQETIMSIETEGTYIHESIYPGLADFRP
jgi:hypothetical protein